RQFRVKACGDNEVEVLPKLASVSASRRATADGHMEIEEHPTPAFLFASAANRLKARRWKNADNRPASAACSRPEPQPRQCPNRPATAAARSCLHAHHAGLAQLNHPNCRC